MSQKIFDFHFHLLFKSFVKKYEQHYPTQRSVEDLKDEFDVDHFLWDKVDQWFLHFLDSQSSYKQITKGNVCSGFVAIAPIEQMFASKKGIGGKLLNDQVVTNPMDPDYLEAVRNGEISYYQLFLRELNAYKKLFDAGAIGLHSRSPKYKKNKSQFVFAMGMEGGHSLIRSKIGRPGVEDDLPQGDLDHLMRDFQQNPLLPMDESLDHLQKAMWAEGMDLRYLVLTHLSHIPGQQTANHAYGAKFLKSELKYPVGMGLTEEGKRVIEAAYNLVIKIDTKGNVVMDPAKLTEEERQNLKLYDGRILIDVKHMSLKAREEFYEYHRKVAPDVPIIASHIGVTGYSISEWVDALDKAEKGKTNLPVVKLRTEAREAGQWGKIPRKFHFNPWTINLMDEDIIAIAESGGLMGVSLDVRILGFVSRLKNVTSDGVYEYLSTEEFRNYFPYYNVKGLPLESYETGLESELFPNKHESHMLAFCFNILHIVSVIANYAELPQGKKPWDFVCIGSDFDGLIDPLKHVRDASRFQKLKGELKKWLPIAYRSYEESNGGGPGIAGTLKDSELEEVIHKFLFQNGEDFLNSVFGGGGSKPRARGRKAKSKT